MIVKNILIGEDIRQEIGNKLSLMGIIGDSLNIDLPPDTQNKLPVSVVLAALVSIENDDSVNNSSDFNLSVTMHIDENEFAKMNAHVGSVNSTRIFHLPVPKFAFQLDESAKLTIKVQITKKEKVIADYSSILNINLNRNQA